MTAADFQLHEIEQLWSRFKEQRADADDLSVAEFAKQFPALATDILRVFPLMMELDEYANTADELPTSQQIPEQIGGYPIVRQIGVGGMGVVYEAQCDTLRERVAIKVISSERLDAKGIERFKQEARAVASLHHTNIVPLYAFGESTDHHFYTMRLIDGPNLADVVRIAAEASNESESDRSVSDVVAWELLQRLRNNWRLIAQWGNQAASALAHAHAKQILHRDVKPANLLIDSANKLWVTDFGLAKRTLDDNSLTSMYHAVGTPRYMAPEQLRGISDERSDIFSLGLTLCELVTLQKMDSATRDALSVAKPGELRKRHPQLPEELEHIILRALALAPQDRYQSAAAMADDLNAFAGKTQPPPEGRRPRTLATTSLGILLAIGGLFLASSTNDAVSHNLDSVAAQPVVHRSDRIGFKVPEGTDSVGEVPADFGDLSAIQLAGEDASRFQFDPRSRQLRFRQTPDFEVPLDRDMDNVYSLQIAEHPLAVTVSDVNEPPQFDQFVFEPDGQTIILSRQQLASAWAIDVRDDSDRLYDGLCLTITGGADRELVKMTTQGVFVFDRKLRDTMPADDNGDGIYEIEVTARDQTPIWFARLEQQPDGKISLLRERVVAGAKLESTLLSVDCLIRRDVVDIATADGKTFYHLHSNSSEKVSLFRSTLTQRGTFESTQLSQDCCLGNDVIGFATLDGKEFRYLTRQRGALQALRMYQATLRDDGSFDSQPLSADCRLPYTIEGFSWLDTTRFHHVRRLGSGERLFYFSFQSGDRFENMRLHESESQYTGQTRGQAAWQEHAATSRSTVQTIRFQIAP
ncbi:Serine/threonine-protein kinase PrkC [Rosistilla carotiformis]|uniref:Serine/threonine-protein kinase PrkC n=1 Tax=Rosistilla carotiformis TaxID=2528017 RepID=A0A518JPI2_9BACT|nr:serine/threonine-protein kinase [Rosistilla carotiformis]QDV67457.1 Serine/threonine-protein kinase PrkC [Rosistilla carotiformis]